MEILPRSYSISNEQTKCVLKFGIQRKLRSKSGGFGKSSAPKYRPFISFRALVQYDTLKAIIWGAKSDRTESVFKLACQWEVAEMGKIVKFWKGRQKGPCKISFLGGNKRVVASELFSLQTWFDLSANKIDISVFRLFCTRQKLSDGAML